MRRSSQKMRINNVILDWFCLINSKGVGVKTFWALMRTFGSAQEALAHVSIPYPRTEAGKTLKSMDCEVILANEPLFPKSLKRSNCCPPMLFFKGDKEILSKRKIAIIGARNASLSGRSIAKNFASNLARDFAIVSGLARGIDTSAHLGSIEDEQLNSAVAVLPFGFDNVYPRENQRLFEKIVERGIVLTEVPNGHAVDAGMFQARNRIISLISEGIIVIEAAYKSGTMATAKLALDFGCEIMVVPGSPADPRNLGSNTLIQNGASLIQNYLDVLELLGTDKCENREKQLELSEIVPKGEPNGLGKKTEILSLLSDTPIDIEKISHHIGGDMQNLLCMISELEIDGLVVRYPNNEVALSGR